MQAGPQLVPAFGIWRSLVPKEEKKMSGIEAVYELKVTLADSRPPIWRRFQVESAVESCGKPGPRLSRSIAVTTMLECSPRALSRRYRAHDRTCAFQAMA